MVVPGKEPCRIVHYEDDGVSQAYETDFATTEIEKTVSGSRTVLKIGPRKGSYAGAPAARRISIVMEGVSSAPAKVFLGGSPLPHGSVCLGGGRLTIDLPESPASEALTVEILK
jgi:hypothetical protein